MENGRNIKVGTDPWSKSKGGFFVEIRENDLDDNTTISQLFKPRVLEWDETFDEIDVRAILHIRIPQHNAANKITWMYMKEGHYTLKSGYCLWQEK